MGHHWDMDIQVSINRFPKITTKVSNLMDALIFGAKVCAT